MTEDSLSSKLGLFNPLKVRSIKLTNKTKLADCSGKINLNCEYCNILYETYACWAKRVNHHFCSHSCHDEFRKIEITKHCVSCGKSFIVDPTKYFKKKTCSKTCSNKIRSKEAIERGGASNPGRGNNNWLVNLNKY